MKLLIFMDFFFLMYVSDHMCEMNSDEASSIQARLLKNVLLNLLYIHLTHLKA